MSTTNFGVSPAPVIGSTTGTFPTPVIPTPIPSNGLASSVTAPKAGMQNPILDAVAGPKCNIVWVENVEGVLNHPTSPNEEMYFQDRNEPVIYRRETDGNGNIRNPIHALRYTVEEIPFGPEAQFVTKDEHQKLYSLVEKLAGNVDSMNDKLEKLLNG